MCCANLFWHSLNCSELVAEDLMKFRTKCVGWKAILWILSFPTSSFAISPQVSLSFSAPLSLWLVVLPVFPLSLPLYPLYFSYHSLPPNLPLCLRLAGWLLHTVMGMHTDVQMCAGCMCVYRRSRQLTAGPKLRHTTTDTLLGERDSKRGRLRGTQRDMEKEGQKKMM